MKNYTILAEIRGVIRSANLLQPFIPFACDIRQIEEETRLLSQQSF
ncbi:hypothetical protein [Paenibacillus sp. GCM10027629]